MTFNIEKWIMILLGPLSLSCHQPISSEPCEPVEIERVVYLKAPVPSPVPPQMIEVNCGCEERLAACEEMKDYFYRKYIDYPCGNFEDEQ